MKIHWETNFKIKIASCCKSNRKKILKSSLTEIVRKLTLVDKTNNIFIQPAMAGGGEPMVSESFIKKK